MSRRFDLEMYAIRHKNGDFVSGSGPGTFSQWPDLSKVALYRDFQSANEVMKEVEKAEEYAFVRVHVRLLAEQDGRKFSYCPSPAFKDDTAKAYKSTKIEQDGKERFWNITMWISIYVILPGSLFFATLPMFQYLYEAAKRAWL